jgi:cell division protein FtsI (penicillin-binding protein 3)
VYGKLGITTSTLPESNWVRTQSNGHQVNLKPMDDPEKAIPNLRGMTARDAMYLLENMGLIVDLKGNGRVRQQSLRPGHRARPNQKIVLYLG